MQATLREGTAPKSDRAPLTLADKQIIALVLTWDVQREVSPNEIEAIAIQHDISGSSLRITEPSRCNTSRLSRGK
jgi:hypothetical protein